MRAVVVNKVGSSDVLQLQDYPDPIPAQGETLVQINLAGINHFDLNQRAGRSSAKTPFIPGVDAVGIEVDTGNRVLVSGVSGGCYAELVAVKKSAVWLLPEEVSDEVAICLAVPYRLAWSALIDRAGLSEGDLLLVQAGSSSTGQAAIDIGRAFSVNIFATSSESKLDRLREMGVQAFAYGDSKLNKIGANVVFDPIGGSALQHSLDAAVKEGIVLLVGALEDSTASVDVWTIVNKRLNIQGVTTSGDRSTTEHLIKLAAQGRLRPTLDRVLPMESASEAHRLIEKRLTFGKVALGM